MKWFPSGVPGLSLARSDIIKNADSNDDTSLAGHGDFPSSNCTCETDVQTQEGTSRSLVQQSHTSREAERSREASGDFPKTAPLVTGTT